jgi:hypothetical protein
MFILDRMLVGTLRFVLDKIAVAADQQLNDETALRERLLVAQLQVELGELTDEEFRLVEDDVVQRLRDIQEARDRDADDRGAVGGVSVETTFDEEA